jgi:hypothetical protein
MCSTGSHPPCWCAVVGAVGPCGSCSASRIRPTRACVGRSRSKVLIMAPLPDAPACSCCFGELHRVTAYLVKHPRARPGAPGCPTEARCRVAGISSNLDAAERLRVVGRNAGQSLDLSERSWLRKCACGPGENALRRDEVCPAAQADGWCNPPQSRLASRRESRLVRPRGSQDYASRPCVVARRPVQCLNRPTMLKRPPRMPDTHG